MNLWIFILHLIFFIFCCFFLFILRGLDQHLPLESGSQIVPQLSFYTPPTPHFEVFKPLTNLSTHASGKFLPLQWEVIRGISPQNPSHRGLSKIIFVSLPRNDVVCPSWLGSTLPVETNLSWQAELTGALASATHCCTQPACQELYLTRWSWALGALFTGASTCHQVYLDDQFDTRHQGRLSWWLVLNSHWSTSLTDWLNTSHHGSLPWCPVLNQSSSFVTWWPAWNWSSW